MRVLLILYILILPPLLSIGQKLKSFNNGPIKLYYEEYGEGPPLYILSGGPGESPENPYHQIIDSLKSSYTCVLLHQRGSGKSRNILINEKTITIKNYLQDIELLQKIRNDKKIIILGMSWGGLLAMNYTALHPASVSNMILVCSAPPSHILWNVLYDNQYVRHSRVELDSLDMLQKIFSAKTDRDLDSLKRADPTNKEVIALKAYMTIHVRAMYYNRHSTRKNFDELFYNFNFQPIPIIDKEVIDTKWDITNDLKKLNTPALIVYGRQDDQGESTFFMQKECLKFSEMHVIEKCGHEILDDQPIEFFNILSNYLKRIKK